MVYFKKQIQIEAQSKAQIRALLFDKAPIEVLVKYFNYNNIFSLKNIVELLENIKINKHVIILKKDKQSSFSPIYSLEPVELETLKTYIKTNLDNSFIRPFKSSTKGLIFFDKKLNKSFCFCMDYQSFNNIIIKNQYLLPLIGKLLD